MKSSSVWSLTELAMKPRMEVFNAFEVNNTKNLRNLHLILTAKFYEKCEYCKFTLRLELHCTRNPTSKIRVARVGF